MPELLMRKTTNLFRQNYLKREISIGTYKKLTQLKFQILRAPDETGFNLKVNISMNRMTAQEIAGSFKEAMKEVG
jgi:hypothetical protein